jgi:hypothetical protein
MCAGLSCPAFDPRRLAGTIFHDLALVVFAVSAIWGFAPDANSLTLDQRVECQRAIGGVYHTHRIWPEANPGPKASFDAALSEEVIRRKVEDALLMTRVLEE